MKVHVSELVRRMDDTSRKLSWSELVVPVLEDYLQGMIAADYNQNYRQRVLVNAVSIYNLKVREDREGRRPLNRDWWLKEF